MRKIFCEDKEKHSVCNAEKWVVARGREDGVLTLMMATKFILRKKSIKNVEYQLNDDLSLTICLL